MSESFHVFSIYVYYARYVQVPDRARRSIVAFGLYW